ncbi:hypothetical protein ACFWY9_28700 [Amycolatopsis sp. NPDC059027]|uniref:hypothetical protein n=1 Tax=Amycolatopsis sp. NPDC059027 TaxID=3346709 RepID=UPI0036715FFB
MGKWKYFVVKHDDAFFYRVERETNIPRVQYRTSKLGWASSAWSGSEFSIDFLDRLQPISKKKVRAAIKPAPKAETPKPRTLVSVDKEGSHRRSYERAYEVSPGRFSWAQSRAEAEEFVNSSSSFKGWTLPNKFYRLVDVETGEEVTE